MEKKFGFNSRRYADWEKNKRSYVVQATADDVRGVVGSDWLRKMVEGIASCNDKNQQNERKNKLPFYTPHYYQFLDNQRDQAHLNEHAFTFRSCWDCDDPGVARTVLRRALELNTDENSQFFGRILRVWGSARCQLPQWFHELPQEERTVENALKLADDPTATGLKLHIDFELPVGMTIAEGHSELSREMGGNVAYDSSVTTPERFIFLTAVDYLIWESPRFWESMDYAECMKRCEAYRRRFLRRDGRPLSCAGVPGAGVQLSPVQPSVSAGVQGAVSTSADDDPDKLMDQAIAVAGVTAGELRLEGQRHELWKRVLSKSGICQRLSQEEVVGEIARVAPDYYRESKAEVEQLVKAFAENYTGTPVRVGTVVTPPVGQHYWPRPARDNSQLPDFMKPLSKNWPSGWWRLLQLVPEDRLFQAVTVHAPAWGLACEGFETIDAMNFTVGPLLQSVCFGPSGAGKHELQVGCDILVEDALKNGELYVEQLMKYNQALKGKSSQTTLSRPQGWKRVIAMNATNAARANQFTEGSGHILYTVESEIGLVMRQLEKSSQGFSPIEYMTKAWAKERVMVDRASAEGVSASVVPMLNVSGFTQLEYVPFYANFIEQGFTSRVCWCHLELPAGVPKLRPVKTVDPATTQKVQQFVKQVEALPHRGVLQLSMLRNALEKWGNDTLEQACADGNPVLADPGLVGRLASNAMRLGLILTVCHMADGKKGGDSSTVTRQCVWMAEGWAREYEWLFGSYVVKKQAAASVFGQGVSGVTATAQPVYQDVQSTGVVSGFYDQLPDEFTLDELGLLFSNEKAATLKTRVYRLKNLGKLVKTATGFKKTASGLPETASGLAESC